MNICTSLHKKIFNLCATLVIFVPFLMLNVLGFVFEWGVYYPLLRTALFEIKGEGKNLLLGVNTGEQILC